MRVNVSHHVPACIQHVVLFYHAIINCLPYSSVRLSWLGCEVVSRIILVKFWIFFEWIWANESQGRERSIHGWKIVLICITKVLVLPWNIDRGIDIAVSWTEGSLIVAAKAMQSSTVCVAVISSTFNCYE